MRPSPFYLLVVCGAATLIRAQMPWEIASLPEDSDEDLNRSEFECFAKCFNVFPSAANKENNNTITKVCERKVTDMRLLRVATTRMYISKITRTWFQAYQFCRKFNMNLVPLVTAATENAFARIITKHAVGGENFWIGGTDMAAEGKFYWLLGGQDVDKNIVKYTATSGTGRCLELRNTEKGDSEEVEYGRSDCSLAKRFVCSFPSPCIVQNGTATT